MKSETIINFSQVSLQNGKATTEQREAALQAASNEGVTNFDYIRGRLYLLATENNVAQATAWRQEDDEDFGDYYDNASALQVFCGLLAQGDEAAGLMKIGRLREFIFRQGDEKSRVCLLPEIDMLILSYWR